MRGKGAVSIRLPIFSSALLLVAVVLPVAVSAQERFPVRDDEGVLLRRAEAHSFLGAQSVDDTQCLTCRIDVQTRGGLTVGRIVRRPREVLLMGDGAPMVFTQLHNLRT